MRKIAGIFALFAAIAILFGGIVWMASSIFGRAILALAVAGSALYDFNKWTNSGC
jgi:hypothetical protein